MEKERCNFTPPPSTLVLAVVIGALLAIPPIARSPWHDEVQRSLAAEGIRLRTAGFACFSLTGWFERALIMPGCPRLPTGFASTKYFVEVELKSTLGCEIR